MSYNSKYKGSEVEALLGKVETLEIPDTSELATKKELAGKVDKVDGKQLSTEDFTTILKQKLEGLSNYNDEQINKAITSLQNQLNALVSGNASSAIESFNEIVAFLEGVTDSDNLDSIIASIEQQIVAKQDKIDDLQSIREGAAKGATAIQEHQDLSDYATKEELKGKEDKKILIDHGTDDTTYALTPNVFHVWGEVASLDLSFAEGSEGVVNEYLFQFTSGATATTLTLPEDVKWANGSVPTIEANMIYQISVLNGLACVLFFNNTSN